MRKAIAVLLLALASNAHAVGSYLGTANQDVTVTSFTVALPAGGNHLGAVSIDSALPAGSNTIGNVGLNAGTNNIGTVTGSSVTSVLSDDGGNHVTVTGGRLDVNANVTSANVSVSTVGIRGSQGTTITSESVDSGKTALDVLNKGRANLDGLALVYKSSDSMVVGGSITLTGKANQVDLQAIGNDCTFNISGGDAINVAKNTAEAYNFDYTATNLVINLTAKSGSATCKARITGAN
jgi:hypothetical protein